MGENFFDWLKNSRFRIGDYFWNFKWAAIFLMKNLGQMAEKLSVGISCPTSHERKHPGVRKSAISVFK